MCTDTHTICMHTQDGIWETLPTLLTLPAVCEQHVAAAAAEAKQQRLVYEDAEVRGAACSA